MKIKIIVATHKPYRMPKDSMYLPLHVGKEGKESINFEGDNTGENISIKNCNYCELTGLYWAWKNLTDADAIGLAHYRRHFASRENKRGKKWERILTLDEATDLCKRYDVIVSSKRKYYIETNYSHYVHAHEQAGLDMMIDVIKNDYPELSTACDVVMNRNWAHMFNMFIMKKKYLDEYCEWLFGILFKIEARLDISSYSAVEARVFGYLSELLLDIWLEMNSIQYGECKVLFMERQNWFVKGVKFLWRKFHSSVRIL
ncbi:MAG: DUF4422 domain-containing protein [Fibromonadaceae bacterium]|jgi:hypothetical protein|nr:DUF4422 domain-containing protein [Fibromonadaceae bacterium]